MVGIYEQLDLYEKLVCPKVYVHFDVIPSPFKGWFRWTTLMGRGL